ncbi:MAG: DNA recombination protein RmuC [Patescibacteria group bacterium]|nr:DNA recombination protein RmuC [Patescibacteria group bacterium]
MDLTTIAIFILILIGFAVLYAAIKNQPQPETKKDEQSLLMLQQQLQDLRRTLDTQLGASTRSMQSQFSESAKIIRDVTERLTKLDETNRQVVSFADQLQNLQDILKNPKQRGILGEYYLEEILKNVLPPGRYQMQYPFKNGDIVDAVIFVQDKVIPIDSKFSLENYNRLLEAHEESEQADLEKAFKQDLKNRIDETAKYVKPEEGTMDFAFMFIPAEAIYYDLLVNKIGAAKTNTRDLIQYAFKDKHVIIVSPTSFLAYLQTVLQGLKALQIEESAKEIRKRVEMLGKHLGSYEDYMKKLGTHLGTSINMYNSAYKELGKIDKDVLKITDSAIGIEPELLERPELTEVE